MEIIKGVLLFSLVFILITGGIGFYKISTTENNWWTKVFCIIEDGKLQQKYFKDICWIKGVSYVADFIGTGEYYSNLTSSDEIYGWQLVEVPIR